jgi:C1A family cysteine protease
MRIDARHALFFLLALLVACAMASATHLPARSAAPAATAPTGAAGPATLRAAPLDLGSVLWTQRSPSIGESIVSPATSGATLPLSVDLSHLRGTRMTLATTDFPAHFDLRALAKLGPVENQGGLNTCWAFAALASLDSCLRPQVRSNSSEDNMVLRSGYFARDDDSYAKGGNLLMATAYLARWAGPVPASADAYGDGRTPTGLTATRHAQRVLMLPPRTDALDNDTIKWAITNHGAVYAAMFYDNWALNDHDSYYAPSAGPWKNHAVAIVGWDDGYSATNFGDPQTGLPEPPGDGAFIVRNSWGTKWGDNGYFYISYYDADLARGQEVNGNPVMSAVFCRSEARSNYRDIYQYDRLGWTTDFGYGSDTACFANAFTCRAAGRLAAVSFYAASLDSSYELRVGRSLAKLHAVASGTFTLPGYYTVKLGSPQTLTEGRGFVVAVRLTTPGCLYPIPVEMPTAGATRATAAAGQSYVSADGTDWSDLTLYYPNTNVCLKAFVKAP